MHPAAVDLQARDEIDRLAQGSAGGDQHLRQQQPFELPGDAIALVLVESAELELADEAGGVAGEGEDRFGTHRVRLLRQRRGAATPLAVVGTLAQLAELVLTHEENIAGHPAAAAGDEAEPVSELADAFRLGVPGDRRARDGPLLDAARFSDAPAL